jgi:hypothetical protein
MGPLAAVMLALAAGEAARASDPAPADPFTEATATLAEAQSYKVRAQAALVLGRRGEARATPHLLRALDDPSAPVRAVAARALGMIGDPSARKRLEAATRDRDPFVRRSATAALAALGDRTIGSAAAAGGAPVPGAGTIQVKPMGDKTHKASVHLREHMRRFVAREVESFRGRASHGFAIDGAIRVLDLTTKGPLVSVTCGVELILSAGSSGAIIVMSTGEATVERRVATFRSGMQTDMEQEALAHAVRGATDELRQHLAANVP